MDNANIELLTHLHAQLLERHNYVFQLYWQETGRLTSTQLAALHEDTRLFAGYSHFEAKFSALVKEMQEFLFLGGDVK